MEVLGYEIKEPPFTFGYLDKVINSIDFTIHFHYSNNQNYLDVVKEAIKILEKEYLIKFIHLYIKHKSITFGICK